MKRLALLLLALTLLTATPAWAFTYSAATGAYTPPATPTDTSTICGSATKTIRVRHVLLSGLQTTAGINRFILLKRSTADTTGTFVASTLVLHDTNYAAATATVGHYTANPGALGTLVGNVRSDLYLIPAAASVITPVVYDLLGPVGRDGNEGAVTLRGTAQCLGINFAGAALPAGSSWSVSWSWTEDSP